MPNNCLSVLYKHIIQVENKNVGLKVGGGHKHTIAPPPIKKVGGHMPPLPPPASYASVYIYICVCVCVCVCTTSITIIINQSVYIASDIW